MTLYRPCALFLALHLLTGCAASPPAIPLPEPRPLGRELNACRAPETPEQDPAPFVEPEGVLKLRDAMAAALLGSPDLASSSHDVRAAEARELQAGLMPNPGVAIELEEFGGDGEDRGFDVSELSLGLSQEILLGGKISKRTAVANLEGRLAGWAYEAARLDVLSRAAVNHARQQLALQRAMRGLAAERQALTATWGGTVIAYGELSGDLFDIRPVPTKDALNAFLADNPELARRAVETELARAKIALERAGGIPDVTLTGGVRRFNQGTVTSFFAGIEFPLPIFDRNQGNVRAARAEADRIREEQRAAVVRLTLELNQAWQVLAVEASEASILKTRVLPLAEGAFGAAGEGFRQGKFSYLEVLDAQRTLFETREQLVDALAAYHTAVADVERLIGRSLSRIHDATDRRDGQPSGHPEGKDR